MKQQQKPFIRIRLFVWSPKPRRVKDLFEEKKKMGSENNNKSNEVSRTQNNKIHDNRIRMCVRCSMPESGLLSRCESRHVARSEVRKETDHYFQLS